MKTYSVEKLPGEPIVISTAFPDWNAFDYMEPFMKDLIHLIDQAEEQDLYYVINLAAWSPKLPEIVQAANAAGRGGNTILHHPKIRKLLIVTQMKLVEIAGHGLNSDLFGKLPVAIFTSLEDAIAEARSLAAQR